MIQKVEVPAPGIRPRGRLVLVHPVPLADKTRSGIYLPPSMWSTVNHGTVVAVGPRCEWGFETGHRVVFMPYGSWTFWYRGVEWRLVPEIDIVSFIEEAV